MAKENMTDKTMGLHDRLLAVQGQISAIKRDADNPYFKSKYADLNAILEEVKPILTENGLTITQPMTVHPTGRIVLRTIIACGEERLESEVFLPDVVDPQKMGSAITYFRRYMLQSLLSLQTTDDDGNGVVEAVKKQTKKPAPKPTSPKEIADKAYKAIEDTETIEGLNAILMRLNEVDLEAVTKDTLIAVAKAKIAKLTEDEDNHAPTGTAQVTPEELDAFINNE